MDISINVFGPTTIRNKDLESDLTGCLPGYVLRILALSADTAVSSGRLINGIYDGVPPKTAPAQLHAHISRLRKALGRHSSLIRTARDGYRLDTDGVHVDVLEFKRLCLEGAAALRRGDSLRAMHELHAALNHWDVLDLPDPVGARVDAALNQLYMMRISALESLTDIQLHLGQRSGLSASLQDVVRANPLDERLRSLLMRVHYLNGRQDRALGEFEDIRRVLDDSLGVLPGPELQRVHAQILTHDPALLPSLPPPSLKA